MEPTRLGDGVVVWVFRQPGGGRRAFLSSRVLAAPRRLRAPSSLRCIGLAEVATGSIARADCTPAATERAVGATFQALPGASVVVNGAAQASNSALTTASADMPWMNGWSAAATFEGGFSNVPHSHAGKGAVRYAW